ncbi:unnamed protein product [Brugia timori]|uniref:Transmembrane protein n=1 Tax=Brugia timori TaxID=42155 RepID=A0A0R3QRY9_9BILA|nr:unnamed protein product [Brugia timori]
MSYRKGNCITIVRLNNHLTGMGKEKITTVRKAIAYLIIPPSFLCGFFSTNFLRAPLLSFQAKCLSLPDNLEDGYNSCHTSHIAIISFLRHVNLMFMRTAMLRHLFRNQLCL